MVRTLAVQRVHYLVDHLAAKLALQRAPQKAVHSVRMRADSMAWMLAYHLVDDSVLHLGNYSAGLKAFS